MSVYARVSRVTETLLRVGRAQEFGLVPDPGAPWLTVCVHSNNAASCTRALALAACGLDFCDACREEWR